MNEFTSLSRVKLVAILPILLLIGMVWGCQEKLEIPQYSTEEFVSHLSYRSWNTPLHRDAVVQPGSMAAVWRIPGVYGNLTTHEIHKPEIWYAEYTCSAGTAAKLFESAEDAIDELVFGMKFEMDWVTETIIHFRRDY